MKYRDEKLIQKKLQSGHIQIMLCASAVWYDHGEHDQWIESLCPFLWPWDQDDISYHLATPVFYVSNVNSRTEAKTFICLAYRCSAVRAAISESTVLAGGSPEQHRVLDARNHVMPCEIQSEVIGIDELYIIKQLAHPVTRRISFYLWIHFNC
jgi:hypothetical protein